jgi:hypothetical protein
MSISPKRAQLHDKNGNVMQMINVIKPYYHQMKDNQDLGYINEQQVLSFDERKIILGAKQLLNHLEQVD